MKFINMHNYIDFFLMCLWFDLMLYSFLSDDNDESSEESSDDGVMRREKEESNMSSLSVNKERLKTSSHTYADTPQTSRYLCANYLFYS